MTSIEQITQKIKDEVQISDRGTISVRATAKVCGVSSPGMCKALRPKNGHQSKLAEVLEKNGFDCHSFSKVGVPLSALEIILRYYAFDAGQNCTDKARELLGASKSIKRFTSRQGWIYVIGNMQHRIAKVGYTTNVGKRLTGIQTSSPYKLKVLAKRKGTYADEKFLHRKFRQSRLEGEWFELTKEVREYFSISPDQHEAYEAVPSHIASTLGMNNILVRLIDALLIQSEDELDGYIKQHLHRASELISVQNECAMAELNKIIAEA